ncbi:MAG: FG-GAP-like repeat-containing protein [Promethearchaeota archaeon]
MKKRFGFILIFLILSVIFSITIKNSMTNLNKASCATNGSVSIISSQFSYWEPQLKITVGDDPSAVCIGDVNNDGQNDLITLNSGNGNVSILLWNTTTGTWDTQITRWTGGVFDVSIGDVNNDGQNEIVTAGGNYIRILCWNVSTSDWDLNSKLVGSGNPRYVCIGDANNDGQNDILAGCTGGFPQIVVLTWNTSKNDWDIHERNLPPVSQTRDVFIGDANNDGQNDIVAVTSLDAYVSILLWNISTGTWDSGISRLAQGDAFSVFVEDANNDGQNDIVTANNWDNNVSILLWNTTAGDWDSQITRPVGNTPQSIFIGDANNDGQNDLIIANWNDDTVSILCWNTSADDWDSQITKPVGMVPRTVFVGDANNDGYNDIVTANLEDSISIYLWKSPPGNWVPQLEEKVGDEPLSVFIGDANNDGQNDLVTANYDDDNVSILCWNTTAGDWDPQITRLVGNGPHSVFIGDVNNDGQNDIVTSNFLHDNVSILLWNTTAGDWDPQMTRSVGDGPYSVFIGDANNDGQNDIVTSNYFYDNVSIFLWNTTARDWDPQMTRSVGDGPYSVFIGDANNDGQNDIVTANHYSDNVSILLWNTTAGDWDPQMTRSVGDGPRPLFIGDANNDGQNDIVVGNAFDFNISILLWNTSAGDWNTQITRTVGEFPTSVSIGDVNNDGQNDIVVSKYDPSNNISILCWNTTAETWDSEIKKSVGYCPRGISIGDANNDGENDIVIANWGDANVTILLWNQVPNSVELELIVPSIDNDGIIDLNWSRIIEATTYYIYRDNSSIISVDGLIPIATCSDSNYTDYITTNGIYYYVIIAENFVGNSSISNCENVIVAIPPSPTNITSITHSFYYNLVIYHEEVQVNWSGVAEATSYYVYRDISNITSIVGLVPMANTTSLSYNENITTEGTYYYVIVTSNGWANSSLSNCENITVVFPLNTVNLSPITPVLDEDGIINLDWDDLIYAPTYYIYRDTSEITSVSGLTPIGTVLTSNYDDTIDTDGIYYYVVVAGYPWGNSSISNCESVTVEIPPEKEPIPGFELFIAIVGIIGMTIMYLRKKK